MPADVDYFGKLTLQSQITGQIIHELHDFYIQDPSKDTHKILDLIRVAKKKRQDNLLELNKAFITPVDKEAISRVYSNLHWIDLSIKHLIIEMDTYEIYNIVDYNMILELLKKSIKTLSAGFDLLNKKKFNEILTHVNEAIHNDNLLIKEYAIQINKLFKKDDIQVILPYKEILSQLKEISKRMHFCANQLEDIVFKMN